MKRSPQALSAEYMRNLGYHVEVVEQSIRGRLSSFKRDMFGFADLYCLHKEHYSVVLVQATSWSNVPARCRKIAESPLIDMIRKAGYQILVLGWKKDGPKYAMRVEDCS